MKCTKCGETDHDSSAVYCHVCGNKLAKTNNKSTGLIITILIILAITAGIVFYINNNFQPFNSGAITPSVSENNYEQRIKNALQCLCEAKVNNDYGRISEIYASHVERYHNIYDVTNSEVVDRYRNYDNKFQVYGKRASIRWNTLQIWQNSYGYSVVFVEDYHIDRVDKSKYSNFVLERHLELNQDFKIVSEYDVQLSKSK